MPELQVHGGAECRAVGKEKECNISEIDMDILEARPHVDVVRKTSLNLSFVTERPGG